MVAVQTQSGDDRKHHGRSLELSAQRPGSSAALNVLDCRRPVSFFTLDERLNIRHCFPTINGQLVEAAVAAYSPVSG